ncbi:hypothetical protein K2X05_09035 [bacterium]|nr:hypothetical protein [bacterium]
MFKSLCFGVLILSTGHAHAKLTDLAQSYVNDRNDCQQIDLFLHVCGTDEQKQIIHTLISRVREYSFGEETWAAIAFSGKNLMIGHSAPAVSTAGRTLAPLTTALGDGRGASCVILFNFDIPESGSHRVGGMNQEWVEFTKLKNFFHELMHAKDQMNGTWQSYRSEQQAIEGENTFRLQLNPSKMNLRSMDYEKGEQIWFPPSAR